MKITFKTISLGKIGTSFKNITGKIKFSKKIAIAAAAVAVTVVTVVLLIRSTKAYEVVLDDTPVGIVKSQAVFETIVEDIVKDAQEEYGTEFLVTSDIEYKEVYLPDSSRIINAGSETSQEQVKNNIALKAKAYAINVDGTDVAYLKDQASAEEILSKIKEPYTSEDESGVTVGFVENVAIVPAEVTADKLDDPDEVYSSLTKETEAVTTYVVQEGDTVSEVAQKLGVKVKDIQKANPDLDIDRISIGQELKLSVPRYAINVKQSAIKTYEDVIPYDTEYEESSELYRGQTKVKIEGAEGKKQVKAELISINGILEETNILEETEITPARTEVILKGTKERPRTLAYGKFIWPSTSRGTITSRFGARWGEHHSGIDIAVPKGTPNKAADGGVVIYAGWYGNYGKLVIIDHENGYTTYYGHNDTITVKKGQRVARGDIIGRAGETGRATGPHLHFEVRKNGVAVNPLPFLNK